MELSTNIRNWGEGSDPATLLACATAAEAAGIDTVWVNERLSTPPGRGWKPGDGGRYLDALMALAFLACATQRLKLGTGVLNVPYRRPFQLVKQVTSVQDLSCGRLRLGLGVGWYETEFRVLEVPFSRRGRLTDEALDLLERAFTDDEIEVNGARLPVLPRPARPPVYIGGSSEAALRRTVRFGDGWIAAGLTPEALAAPIARLDELAEAAGRSRPVVIAMKTLPLSDPPAALAMAQAYAAAGVDELVHADGYPDLDAYRRRLDRLTGELRPALR